MSRYKTAPQLVTRDIYISFVVKYYRKNINEKLASIPRLTLKKRYVSKLRNPRHTESLADVCDINYTQYKQILEFMNKKVIEQVTEEKTLNLGHSLGRLFIKTFERKFEEDKEGKVTSAINWGESNKYKQQLIDDGLVPLKGNNGGVEWHIYYTHLEIKRFSWMKVKKTLLFNEVVTRTYALPDLGIYYFKPTKGNRQLLHRAIEEEEEMLQI